MRLPLSIDNVLYYKIAGQFCFQGDLIFTPGCIYFFPHTDLDEVRDEVTRAMDVVGGPLLGTLIVKPYLLPVLRMFMLRTLNRSSLHASGVWTPADSSESLQVKLAGLIARAKRTRRADGLPPPSRFGLGEVGNLKLSAAGTLSFDAQSDRHDFGVGLFKKGMVREALVASGFVQSPQDL